MKVADSFAPKQTPLRLVPGVAQSGGMISVGGVAQPAVWTDGAHAAPGDAVQVLFIDRGDYTSQAVVVGRTGKPGAVEGTIQTVGSRSATVAVPEGTVQAAVPVGVSVASGDVVRLLWQGSTVTVLGVIDAAPDPPPPDEDSGGSAPPPPKSSGHETFTASDSGTWSGGLYRWNSYYKSDVFQGDGTRWGAPSTHNGAWFYHGKPGKYAGKPAKRIELWLPERKRSGFYNNTVTLNVYLHTSRRRPNGDVSRDWSTQINVRGGFNGGWVDLPIGWWNKLTEQDYGIAIAHGVYAGFDGVKDRAKSGALRLTYG